MVAIGIDDLGAQVATLDGVEVAVQANRSEYELRPCGHWFTAGELEHHGWKYTRIR